jgi:hypothetical protein
MVKRMEMQSARLGRNIDRQVIVFNMKNLTYSLDPSAMNTFIRTVKVDQTMYPQRLETLFIINSPWFFRAIWAVISPWVDPITAAKIKILGSDYLKTLTEFIDIEQVPAEWGGKRTEFPWQFPHVSTQNTTQSPPISKYPLMGKSVTQNLENIYPLQ